MSDDVMAQPWCCLACAARFVFGKLRYIPGSPDLHCPSCQSGNVHPADGTIHELTEYHGERGPLQ